MLPDPTNSSVTILSDTVVKTHHDRDRFTNELIGYTNNYWAAPRVVDVDLENMVLVTEKCVPLDKIPPDLEHRNQLRRLLEDLHSSGWNHRDCAILNAVLHPKRGVLLIDWESCWKIPEAGAGLSYDLFGARASGYPGSDIPLDQMPDGVWWGGKRWCDPLVWWGS